MGSTEMVLAIPSPRTSLVDRSWTNIRPRADSVGARLTANNTAHSLSSTFTEIFTSTKNDASWVRITIWGTGTNNVQTDALLHLYIGGSGSEQIWIPSLAAGWSIAPGGSEGSLRKVYEFPLSVPAGTRISGKLQAAVASDLAWCHIELHDGDNWAGHSVEAVGVNTASSIGTIVTPGSTSDGSVTNIGTTVNEWRYISARVQGGYTDTALGSVSCDLDICAGDAVLRDMWKAYIFGTTSTESVGHVANTTGFFTNIAAGTALQARMQSSGTAENYDVILYGVY
jgi:hypothetical protein